MPDSRQPFQDDERIAIERHVRELDRLGEDLAALDTKIAESALAALVDRFNQFERIW